MPQTYTYRQIWQVTYPILLSVLMEQLIGITDTAFLGRVGEVELGASALGNIFYSVIFMLGLGFATGAQILMGRRNGEGNYAEVGRIFNHTQLFLLLLAAVLFVGAITLGPVILSAIISSPDVAEASNSYLYWRSYAYFFSFVNAVYRAFYVGTTHTRVLTYNSVVMVVANVILNYILIFGHLGCPALGIAGAAIASTLANVLSTVFFVIYTRRYVDGNKYGLHLTVRLRHYDFSLLRRVLNVGVWTMLQNVLSLGTWFVFFIAVEHLGERQLAATNLVRNISSISFMTLMAFGSTASTLTSNLIGRGEADAVRPVVGKVVRMGFFLLVPFYILVCLFPEAVLSLFTNEGGIIAASVAPVFVLASSYILNIPAQIYLFGVQGTGNTRRVLLIECMALVFYTLFVVVVIFMLRSSLPVCWLGEHVYAFFALIPAWLYFRGGSWRQKKI